MRKEWWRWWVGTRTGRGSAVRPDGFAADCKGQGCARDWPRVAHWGDGHHLFIKLF